MNSMEMLRENVQTASETDVGEFTGEDEAFLQDVVSAINSKVKVGCTGCRYCMPCPHGVDIPGTLPPTTIALPRTRLPVVTII